MSPVVFARSARRMIPAKSTHLREVVGTETAAVKLRAPLTSGSIAIWASSRNADVYALRPDGEFDITGTGCCARPACASSRRAASRRSCRAGSSTTTCGGCGRVTWTTQARR